jgi:AcrR family transcriptional regulator
MTPAPANIADASDNGTAPQDSAAGEDASRQRKRGAELEQAIRDATIAELGNGGYGNLTIESVAARAQTGKASIYRRWPTKQELVFDSVCCLMAAPVMDVTKLELTEDVTTAEALFLLARQAAYSMTGPRGAAMRSIMSESLRDEDFAASFEDNFQDPRKQVLNEVLARGVERGEIRADVVGTLLIDILAGALIHRYLVRRLPVTDEDVAAFIDGFVMPAIGPA